MATPFSDVYERFLSKVNDYDYINLEQEDLEDILKGYLISAITMFRKCKKDLSDRDSETNQFNETLDDEEIEILALGILWNYLSPKIYTGELMKQSLSSKDYKLFSQANFLKELRQLRDDTKRDMNELLVSYSYSRNDLSDLK